MHIPDGFLDGKTAVAGAALAAAGVGWALREVRRTVPPRRVPLIGLASAFLFAAQMVNFPVAGGTSGHLMGGVLAAVLLGPGAAVVVMTAVLILQCFMFADGGVTALGANVFNMALVAPLAGYGVYRGLARVAGGTLRARLLGTAFGAWCSTVATSVACAGQLAIAGTVPWRAALPAMAGIHMLIGLGEAAITTLVIAAVARARPELLRERDDPALQPSPGEWVGYAFVAVLGLAFFVAPFACGWPDGLEKIAAALGFEHRASRVMPAPMPDYTILGWAGGRLSVALAGTAGAGLAFLLAYGLAKVLTPHGGAVPRQPANEVNPNA